MAKYLTTTLPYVNSDPHIGFATEILQADVLARSWRLAGEEVFFNTGTDEHGQKIFEAAEKAGKPVQEYVDYYAEEFKKLGEVLGLSEHAFIRTTDEHHVSAAQEMWRRCAAAGDIYKKTYSGLYCVGCELYKTEKDLTPDGFCLIHTATKPQELSEENYFFKFSKYQQALEEYLSRESAVIPSWRREEALAFVRAGLEDFSISREKARLTWGIPVPDDDTQVMYVWFDALTNYISTLGWPKEGGAFKTFWEKGTVVQVAGKDQVRFQSLMWQAMLMSAQVKNTDTVFYHGFINSGGQKMSKSLGNVISPYELVQKYGTEATRYLLLRHVHPTEDSDITWERLDEWYTANLVNGIGNLVARVMKLAETHLDTPVDTSAVRQLPEIDKAINQFSFNEATDHLWFFIGNLDALIQEQKPFELVKTNKVQAQKQISYLVVEIARLGQALEPFMPQTTQTILAAVKANKKPENLFPRLG